MKSERKKKWKKGRNPKPSPKPSFLGPTRDPLFPSHPAGPLLPLPSRPSFSPRSAPVPPAPLTNSPHMRNGPAPPAHAPASLRSRAPGPTRSPSARVAVRSPQRARAPPFADPWAPLARSFPSAAQRPRPSRRVSRRASLTGHARLGLSRPINGIPGLSCTPSSTPAPPP